MFRLSNHPPQEPGGRPTDPATLLLTDLRDAALTADPPLVAVALALNQTHRGTLDAHALTFWADPSPTGRLEGLQADINGDLFNLWFRGGRLAALTSATPLTRRQALPVARSNFSPPGVTWPWWEKGVPPFHTTALAQRLSAWEALLGPFLGRAARTILTEGFVIPRKPHRLEPIAAHNHTTVDQDPALINSIVAKYILGGVVEQLPRGAAAPSVVHPLGLVPKKSTEEPWRIIHDCRGDNQTIVKWPSHLHGLAASAFLFSSRAFAFTLDIKAAYLTIPLRGCGGGLRRTGRTLPDGSPEHVMGCSVRDGTCRGGCDKDRLGFIWGTPYRMNAPPFGMTVSSNALEVLTSAFVRRWTRRGCRIVVWVDDLLFLLPNPHRGDDHAWTAGAGRLPPWFSPPSGDKTTPLSDLQELFVECGGLQACATCQRAFARACDVRRQVVAELRDLGWMTNEKDSGDPDMAGTFVGIPFDTERFTFHIPDAKRDAIQRRVLKTLRLELVTPRRVAKLRGKIMWFGIGMPFAPAMT